MSSDFYSLPRKAKVHGLGPWRYESVMVHKFSTIRLPDGAWETFAVVESLGEVIKDSKGRILEIEIKDLAFVFDKPFRRGPMP